MTPAPIVETQRTTRSAISCRGVGLHSGQKTMVTLRPAPPDTGIVFRRTDPAGGGAEIPALWSSTVESALCTTLTNGEGITISTVEHLLAALAGCGIDNVVVEVDGAEVPIMDGSAEPFVFLIDCAGTVEQDAPRRAIKVLKPVVVGDGQRRAELLPDHGFSVGFLIDFPSRAISRQELAIPLDRASFKAEISRARTFGFAHEIEGMRAAGLARGGSLDNAVVIGGDRVLNPEGLRFADEFVRHKVLDAVGDLALAGAAIIGHFRGVRSGHMLTRAVLRALFADPSAWCMTVATAPTLVPGAGWDESLLLARA